MIKKIRNIVKGIDLNIKMVKAVFKNKDGINKIYTFDMVNSDGIIVEYNPATLAVSGVCMCGTSPVQFGVVGPIVQRIVYDDLYLELSENTQKFIMEHEKGHFQLNHFGGVRNINDEYDADSYAARIIGKEAAIDALKEMAELLSVVSFSKKDKSVLEVQDRIENLKLM